MSEVILRIKGEHDALTGEGARAEVVRILREAASRIESGRDDFALHDINGNKVGDLDAYIGEEE